MKRTARCLPLALCAGSARGTLWRSRTGGATGDSQRVRIGYPVPGVETIADAGGHRGRLYFAGGSITSPDSLFDASPATPEGSFDARYAHGAIAAFLKGGPERFNATIKTVLLR